MNDTNVDITSLYVYQTSKILFFFFFYFKNNTEKVKKEGNLIIEY